MRVPLLMFIATIGLIASATAATADTATTVGPSEAAESGQTATWTPRELLAMGIPLPGHSCGDVKGELRFVLIQLGARASDLNMGRCDYRFGLGPHAPPDGGGLSATFSVLVPADTTGKNAADAVAGARQQTVELRTGTVGPSGKLLALRNTPTSELEGSWDRTCGYLKSVAEKILPLFSVRHVKLIPEAVCEKYGVGLRAQVLMPAPQLAASP
jgi:hypothetical protein